MDTSTVRFGPIRWATRGAQALRSLADKLKMMPKRALRAIPLRG